MDEQYTVGDPYDQESVDNKKERSAAAWGLVIFVGTFILMALGAIYLIWQ